VDDNLQLYFLIVYQFVH